jgi:hypothetical protein
LERPLTGGRCRAKPKAPPGLRVLTNPFNKRADPLIYVMQIPAQTEVIRGGRSYSRLQWRPVRSQPSIHYPGAKGSKDFDRYMIHSHRRYIQHFKEGGNMQTSKKDRPIKNNGKQAAAGKKTISIRVDDWLKKMIDEECKRANCTVADVITKSVVNFVDSSAI